MDGVVISVIIFLSLVFIMESGLYAYRNWRNPDRNKIRERLKTVSASRVSNDAANLLRNRRLSEVPLLHRILEILPGAKGFDRHLQEANIQYSLGFFFLLALILAAAGFSVITFVTGDSLYAAAGALLLAMIPFFIVHIMKRRRLAKLERQLPEALTLMARALRAGHAFSSAMKFTSEEFDDPIGMEFGKALDEINFGVSVSDALRNMVERIDSQDLKYFAVSMIIQRDAGGNLAEVMDRIAYIIRERFKLRGKVRVLSSEGKMTAGVLLALPILVVTALTFTNPEYIEMLWTEPLGRKISLISALMMATGVFVIRKMIRIKVQ